MAMNKELSDLDQRLKAVVITARSSVASYNITSLRLFVSMVEQGNIAQVSRNDHIVA